MKTSRSKEFETDYDRNWKNRTFRDLFGCAAFAFICFMISITALLLLLLFSGCKKEDSAEKNKQLHFTLYSSQAKYVFHWIDEKRNWHTDTLTGNIQRDITIMPTDMTMIFSVTGATSQVSDSAYIKCEVDGKNVEHSARVQYSSAMVTVQPSEAK